MSVYCRRKHILFVVMNRADRGTLIAQGQLTSACSSRGSGLESCVGLKKLMAQSEACHSEINVSHWL